MLLLTDLGAQKIAAASSAGGGSLTIAQFAVGQGIDVDFSQRLDKQVLVSKRYQGDVQGVLAQANSPNTYEITCIVPANVGGFVIRELGLIADDGTLMWVGSLPEVEKPDSSNGGNPVDYRIKAVITINNGGVNLVVDTNVLTATVPWVQQGFVAKSDYQSLLDRLEALEENAIVKIGQIVTFDIHFEDAAAVATYMGYGTWERALEGRVSVGFSDDPNDSEDVRTFGTEFGEFEHQLTADQMPRHAHQSVVALPAAANAPYFEAGTAQPANIGHTLLNDTANSTDNQLVYPNDSWGHEGGDEPFDISQPSKTVDKWKRIA